MKTNYRIIRWFTLLLLFTSPAILQAQFNYITNNGAITITKYIGSSGTVAIPDMINGYPVTTIGTNAFYFSNITNITFPDSLTSIEYNAFYYCSRLANVIIPDSVTNIGDGAFQCCSVLCNVTLGTNVATIGSQSFGSCPLTNILIPDSVTCIEDGAFSRIHAVEMKPPIGI